MRVLQINGFYPDGSTGKIVQNISNLLEEEGENSFVAFGSSNKKKIDSKKCLRMKTGLGLYISIIQTRLGGRNGFNDRRATYRLIQWIEQVNPNVIHLHNIHGFYINIEILFSYLKAVKLPVIWTLHDCWSITGHCACFDYVGCDKWKNGCNSCEQLKYYPISFCDKSKENYWNKKEIFTSLEEENLKIVVPSQWLGNIIKQSFLNKYEIRQIYNGVDLNLFKPTLNNIRNQYGLDGKKIILTVVYGYNERKGLLDLNLLADLLDTNYQIIVVGVEKKAKKKFNPKILVLEKTKTQYELAQFYSVADVYVNLTLEEVMGMTNIEALACGTPVVTYSSGGSPECVDDKTGKVVERRNIHRMKEEIEKILSKPKTFYSVQCRLRAEEYFDNKKMAQHYLRLYEEMLTKTI